MAASSVQILLVTCLYLVALIKSDCPQTGNEDGLPTFQSYGPGGVDGITYLHQAIIPSYQLVCNQSCGVITEWGVDLQPGGRNHQMAYTLDFQVWRPSPTVDDSTGTGCYSLVGNNRFSSTSLSVSDGVARVTPSPPNYILFRPGDVLGFYVEEAREATDGVVVLTRPSSLTSELVWYASIAPTMATSQNGDCPYPVGSNGGVLNTLTRAAPVITISTVTFPCPSLPSVVTTQPTPPPGNGEDNNREQMPEEQVTPPDNTGSSAPNSINVTDEAVTTYTTDNFITRTPPFPSLIVGAAVAGVVVLMMLTLLSVVTIIVVLKRRKKGEGFNIVHKNLALDNQMYGKKASRLPEQSYDYIDLRNSSQASVEPRQRVRYKRTPETVHMYADLPVSANHSSNVRSGGQPPRPPLPLPRADVVTASDYSDVERRDYDYAETQMSDTYVDVDVNEYDEAMLLNGGPSKAKINVNEDVFDRAGIYVPTLEQRVNLKSHYVLPETRDYNKLKFFEEEKIYWAPASTKSDLYMQLASKKYREIPRNQIKISTRIGSGQFGEVCKAVWSVSGTKMELAIKTLKPGSKEDEKLKVLQEAAIMGQFFHPYVVRLYGVVTVGEPVIICLELMENGDLRNYLISVFPEKQDSRALEVQFLRFSKQIAEGMDYLASKSFVHRDLAARNILLDDSLTCKIGDFGMARDLMNETYYTAQSKGAKVPVKWTAPEALHYKRYSTDSDVWSYGMVLFEIWSVGKKPFSQHTNNQVLRLVQTGHCQPPPPGCPRAIYKLMVDCWNPDHSERPTSSKISHYLMSSSVNKLLEWAEEEGEGDEALSLKARSRELGAPLSEGKELHKDLQNTYHTSQRLYGN